jgi:peptide deformylase
MSLDWEACFSVPKLMGKVNRYVAIKYKALTISGEKFEGIARGFFARVLQHEIDHLDGVVWTDLIKEGDICGVREDMMKIREAELAESTETKR